MSSYRRRMWLVPRRVLVVLGLGASICTAADETARKRSNTPESVVEQMYQAFLEGDEKREVELTARPVSTLITELTESRQELEASWKALEVAASRRFGKNALDTHDFRRSRLTDAEKKVRLQVVSKKELKTANQFEVQTRIEGENRAGKYFTSAGSAIVVRQDGKWRVISAQISYGRLSRSALERWFDKACAGILRGHTDVDLALSWDEADIEQRVRDCRASVKRLCAELQKIAAAVRAGEIETADRLRDRLGKMDRFAELASGDDYSYRLERIAIDLQTNSRGTTAVFAFTRRGSLEKRRDGFGVVALSTAKADDQKRQTEAAKRVLDQFAKALKSASPRKGRPSSVPVTMSIDDDCPWQHVRTVVAACNAAGFGTPHQLGGKKTQLKGLRAGRFEYECLYSYDLGRPIGMSGVPKPKGVASFGVLVVSYDAKSKAIMVSAGGEEPLELKPFAAAREARRATKTAYEDGTGPLLVVFAAKETPFGAVDTVMKRFRANNIVLDAGNPATEKPIPPPEIEIDSEGAYRMDGERIAVPKLIERLKQQVKNNPDVVVILRADATAKSGVVQEAIAHAQSAGVRHFALRARKPPVPKKGK